MEISCQDAALKYLMYMSRSAYEVEKHLKSKGYEGSEIKETMDFLKDFHYIDDEEYCRIYVNNQMGKGKGPIRIKNQLKEKGISSGLIDLALEEYCEPEQQREQAMAQAMKILNLTRKEWAEEPEELVEELTEEPRHLTEKDLARIARKLSYLGYSSSIIYWVLGRLS